MTQPSTMPADDQSHSDYPDSPGRRLRELRESRGIEIERITAQLHLGRNVVEALEQDRYADLPSPVFVAGYLKNYARLLGTNPEPILQAYRTMVPAEESYIARSVSEPRGKTSARSGSAWAWPISLLLIGVAAALLVFWWQWDDVAQFGEGASESADAMGEQFGVAPDSIGAPEDTQPSDTDVSDGSATTPIDSFGSAVSVPPDAIPLRGMESTTDQRPAETDDGSTIPADSLPTEPRPTQSPEPVAEAPDRDIVLQFSGTSWVDVRDATGKVVLNGEMREGEQRTLTGEPPFKLVIGNAAATQLSVGGTAFDLGSHALGNVARFSLDPNTTE